MPEGDTVWLTARRLHEALAGRPLRRSDFRVPRLATTDLTGRSVTDVVAAGKHLLVRVDGGLTVHSHLKMEGTWRIGRPGRACTGGPAWQVRLLLGNDEWDAAGYRLGVVHLLATRDEHRVVGHLGPDIMSDAWDPAEAARRLLAEPQREIGDALLDQRAVAGIGNLYKNEALHLTGVSPFSPVGAVDVGAVLRVARRLMLANRDGWRQTTTDGTTGAPTAVFERAGRPCPRCATSVAVTRQGAAARERLTYWCPGCQPGIRPTP